MPYLSLKSSVNLKPPLPKFCGPTIMALLRCIDCGRNAECSCMCRFPLPLLCEEHQHSTHFPFLPQASIAVKSEEVRMELSQRLTKLSQLYAQIQSCGDIEQLAEATPSSLLAQLEQAMSEFREQRLDPLSWSEEWELEVWLSAGRGLAKGHRVEESCSVLERRWKLSGREGLALALAEVVGLRMGRFPDALAVLEQLVPPACGLQPASEIYFQWTNTKAAVMLQLLNYENCEAICTSALLSPGSRSEEAYATALYFFTIAYSQHSSTRPELEALALEWISRSEQTSSRLLQLLRLCVTASLRLKKANYREAEDPIEQAAQLASQYFPTSIHAGLCSFWKAVVHSEVRALKGEPADYQEYEDCLSVLCPGSLMRAVILVKQAEFQNRMREDAKELALRWIAHGLLQANPSCKLFLDNLDALERLYSQSKRQEAALALRLSAHHTLLEGYLTSSNFLRCVQRLMSLYESMGLRAKAETVGLEAMQTLQAAHPTHKHFYSVLDTFVEYHERNDQLDIALPLCIEKYEFLRTNHSSRKNYRRVAHLLAGLYVDLGMESEALDTYLEAVQIAKASNKVKDYTALVESMLLHLPSKFPSEKEREVRLEAHQFLASQPNAAFYSNANKLVELCDNQPEKCIEQRLAVHRALQADPSSPEYCENLGLLVSLYEQSNQLEKAVEVREEAHELLRSHATNPFFFTNANELFAYYGKLNLWDKALSVQLEVRQLTEPHSWNYLVNLSNLLSIYANTERPDLLVTLLLDSLRQVLHLPSDRHSDWIVEELCKVHCASGNVDAAIHARLDYASQMRLSTDSFIVNTQSLADLYVGSGRIGAAVELYYQALLTTAERCDYDTMEWVLMSVKDLCDNLKQRERAIDMLARALDEMERKGDVKMYANCLPHLLQVCERARRSGEQIQFSLKALRFLLSSSDISTSQLLHSTGRLYSGLGSTGKAEIYWVRAVRVATVWHFTFNSSAVRSLYEQPKQ